MSDEHAWTIAERVAEVLVAIGAAVFSGIMSARLTFANISYRLAQQEKKAGRNELVIYKNRDRLAIVEGDVKRIDETLRELTDEYKKSNRGIDELLEIARASGP